MMRKENLLPAHKDRDDETEKEDEEEEDEEEEDEEDDEDEMLKRVIAISLEEQ